VSRVLIIEDEPIIALDIENLVTELGHEVVAKSTTAKDAVKQAHLKKPGLILADINLGEGGSGIDAVSEILASFDVPVIFITAYPERLLTGERPEPTYLIAKPFLPETVQATVGQALFFHPIKRRAA
jgi:CheY-like chemotaxis protein